MCYGSIDPKYLARDITARVRPLSQAQVPEKEGAPEVPGGAMAWARALWARISPKDVRHA
jgi:hypothetical protein